MSESATANPSEMTPPRLLYRAVRDAAAADAFCNGDIWLSTLEICRKLEGDVARHDPEEGQVSYRIEHLSNVGPAAVSSAELARRAKKVQITIEGGTVELSNITGISVVPDMYLLSFSDDPELLARKFTSFIVEVRHPDRFIERIARALQRSGCSSRRYYGPITYTKRNYDASEDAPAPSVFIKPDKFAEDREFRMVWHPGVPGPLDRRLVQEPWAGNLCRRFS